MVTNMSNTLLANEYAQRSSRSEESLGAKLALLFGIKSSYRARVYGAFQLFWSGQHLISNLWCVLHFCYQSEAQQHYILTKHTVITVLQTLHTV